MSPRRPLPDSDEYRIRRRNKRFARRVMWLVVLILVALFVALAAWHFSRL